MPITQFDLWHKRLERAKADRDPHEKAWKKIHKEIVGPNYRITGSDSERSPQPVSLSNNFIRLMLPRLLPKDRVLRAEVTPKRPDSADGNYSDGAKILPQRLNAILDETRAIDEVRRALRLAMYSCGILQLVLNVRTGVVEEVESEKADGGKITIDVDKERVGGHEYIDPNLPGVKHVKPDRLLVDPGASSFDDARWVAVETFPPVEALKIDPLFVEYMKAHNIDPAQLKGTHDSAPRAMQMASQEGANPDLEDPQLSLLQLWEIHDRDSRKVILLPGKRSNVKEPILVQEQLPIEGLPFSMLAFEEVDGHFWPNPPMSTTHDGKKAANRMLRFVIESVDRAKTVIGYDPEVVKEAEMIPLTNATDGAVVGIKGLTKHVQEFKFGGFHPDVMEGLETVLRLNDMQDGLDEIRRGVAGSRPDVTATEIRTAESQGAIRIDDMRSELDKAVRRIVECMSAVLIQLTDLFQDVSLPIGDPKEQQFVALGGSEEVVGSYLDYTYEIKVTTQDRVDPAIRLKRTETSIAVLTNADLNMKLQAEGYQLMAAPVVEDYLRQLGHRNTDKILIGGAGAEDTEAQAARAEAEDRDMLSSGQPLPVSPDDDHETHMQVHQRDWERTKGPDGVGNESIAAHATAHEMAMTGGAGGSPGPTGPAQQPGPAGQHVNRAPGQAAPAAPVSPMAARGNQNTQAAGQAAEARRV
jgi:hypothetical protein